MYDWGLASHALMGHTSLGQTEAEGVIDNMNGTTRITPEQREAFEAISNPEVTNIALLAVTYKGEPTTAIVAVTLDGEDFVITPMFVAPTEAMLDELRDPSGLTPAAV